MKRKYIFSLALAGALSFSMSSCDDFVDLAPISDATTGNAYQTARDAETALVGVYESFQSEFYIWDNIHFNDVITDNYYAGGDNQDIIAIDLFNLTPNSGRLWDRWGELYNAIYKANVVLQQVPNIQDPQLDVNNRREQILGEASFLRAYHYYNLVKMWGGVPLYLEPVQSLDKATTQKSRSTEAEVYAQIITDLEFAAQRLPDAYGDNAGINKARATKGAVNALLAKVYAQKPDRDYNRVVEYANAVINSPAGYTLLSNYADLFDGAHYNNAESILEVQFTGGTEGNWGPNLLLPPSLSASWRKFVTPSKDLVAAFDSEKDKIRKDASIIFENVSWVDEYWSPVTGGSVPFAFKWKSAANGSSTNRQYIFRLADIILLKAEALNALGRTEEARTTLNLVRSRAKLADVTTTDQAQLKMAILKERRLELAQEAQRWDDLRRNGVAVQVMNELNEINLLTNQRIAYNVTANDLLLPIPQQEINRNPNLAQNPGF